MSCWSNMSTISSHKSKIAYRLSITSRYKAVRLLISTSCINVVWASSMSTWNKGLPWIISRLISCCCWCHWSLSLICLISCWDWHLCLISLVCRCSNWYLSLICLVSSCCNWSTSLISCCLISLTARNDVWWSMTSLNIFSSLTCYIFFSFRVVNNLGFNW